MFEILSQRGIGKQRKLRLLQVGSRNKMVEQENARCRIEQCRVIPCVKTGIADALFNPESIAKKFQGVGGQCWVDGAGKAQRVDPWSESMTRERTQKSTFRAGAMGDEDFSLQGIANFGPKGKERRCVFQSCDIPQSRSWVHLRRRQQVAAPGGFGVKNSTGETRDTDFHRHIAPSAPEAGRLEINPRKAGLRHRRLRV